MANGTVQNVRERSQEGLGTARFDIRQKPNVLRPQVLANSLLLASTCG